MKYACNFSQELLSVLNVNSDFCDYIKIGAFGETIDYLEVAYQHKPLIIHGFGWFERGGMDSLDTMDFTLMNKMLKTYNSPFLGMHILAYKKDCLHGQVMMDEEVLLQHMVHIFKGIQEQLSIELILENIDYSPYYSYETSVIETVTPKFICQLIERTRLNLLLDIAHAKVSAYQLGLDIMDYLEALPLENIREIHFSGCNFIEGKGYVDKHDVMEEEDYAIASFLANHTRIQASKLLSMVTLEYGTIHGTKIENIQSQMKRLKELFG